MGRYRFVAHGLPAAQGSMSSYGGRVVANNAGKLAVWRSIVRQAAIDEAGFVEGVEPEREKPWVVTLVFSFVRPKGHMGTGRNAGKVKPSAPKNPTKPPDIDKLARAVLDALTGLVWHDDAQVVRLVIDKQYHHEAGCAVSIWEA